MEDPDSLDPVEDHRPEEAVKRVLPFEFTGSAGEYFRIWFVNVLLNILTLGIYSAWAKVRNKQYFYRHTWLDGTSFEYHGDPQKILKGRLILGVFFIGLYISSTYSLWLNYGLIILLYLISPWLAVKSWAFNARNSSFRNVRFSFRGTLGEAYSVMGGLQFLSIVTLGLLVPYTQMRTASFKIDGHRYGTQRFSLHTTAGTFYSMYIAMGGIAFVGYTVTTVFTSLLTKTLLGSPSLGAWTLMISVYALLVAVYLPLFLSFTYLRATTANIVYGNTRSGRHRLHSEQHTWPLFWIYLGNLFAILLSLGLLAPWAKIRLARYRTRCLSLRAGGSLEVMADDSREDPSAVGEAGIDFGGFDFGL